MNRYPETQSTEQPHYILHAMDIYKKLSSSIADYAARLERNLISATEEDGKRIQKELQQHRSLLIQLIEFEAKLARTTSPTGPGGGPTIDLEAARDELRARCAQLRDAG